MKDSKNTKRALAASIGCVALCTAMLVGTTFAWFTDTATTSINKIQAGTLDVQLVDKEGNELTNGLSFANNASSADILWEPGATFNTGNFYVKNNGNLALKYKLSIDGVTGDNALLDAIDFYVMRSDDIADAECIDLNEFEGNLKATETSSAFYIRAKMKESAGNEFQGLSLEGIKISAVATQDTVEYDSTSNTYDQNAEYPTYGYGVVDVVTDGDGKVASTETVATEATIDGATPLAQATVPEGVVMDNGASQIALSVATTSSVAEGTVVSDGQAAKSFEISLTGVSSQNTKGITVEFYTEKNLGNVKVFHNGVAMDASAYSYDESTGKVTIKSATFSPFDLVYDAGAKAASTEAGLVSAFANAQGGDTIKLTDNIAVSSANYNVDKRLHIAADNVTLDLNGKTLSVANHTLTITGENVTVKNGTLVAPAADTARKYSSYAIAVSGVNATLDGVTTYGGVSVTGYDDADEALRDWQPSATITNCNITADKYYTVCAQGNASAVIKNTTLNFSNGTACFWIENGNSSISYQESTVTMNPSEGKDIYLMNEGKTYGVPTTF